MGRLYLSAPHMDGAELERIREAFESNWISSVGPEVEGFEADMVERIGAGHALAVSSGTAALHLAVRHLGVGHDDVVLCSTLTFIATATPVLYEGATPVFVDADRESWNMDPALLAEELEDMGRRGRRPSAVVVADVFGQCADYRSIEATCDAHEVPLVEDAAEALGASCHGTAAGRFGRCGVFSFNGNKIITTSSGGMLVSDDAGLIDHARYLATQARDPAPHYQHSEVGYNYRMSNLLAAVGRAQLAMLDRRVARRREIFARYSEGLGDLEGIDMMPEPAWSESNRWLTCITIEPEQFGATREDLRVALEARNIEARPLWKPLHLQPLFRDCRVVGGQVAEELFDVGLCLPSGSGMTDEEQDRVIETIRGAACNGTGGI